ncbi:repressor [Pectobacterium brasiliense]|uniref:LexA family protein n=1 Tax=Pectobacterium brasiliense TaxID=180957 RepID=UPI0001A444D7|nr:LexA family transcriptional regulator [Pectobacterium brasiliense]KGA24932.1 repressor [Pectobacterium brasiliense]KRF62871.1 repressor [Pectobacterium brasiliense]MBN3186079.1 LexA family transcriptional regulator [Pectobacterium brasiliense]QHG26910.1 helix-turn-helix domain-containing protein [Pectobacterium brasiliense]
METKKTLTREQLEAARKLKALYQSKKKELNVTQYTIADELGISQGAVGHYLNGRIALNVPVASGFSRILQIPISEFSPELARDAASYASTVDSNVAFHGIHDPKGEYPVISWVSAGEWSEAIEPYHRRAIDRWYGTTVDCSDSSFWLDVKGDSMTSPVGLSIPEGMVILVDPEVEPINGKLVVAKLDGENEATFKKYVEDAGHKFLKPLNPQYPLITINGNCRIIGVVVDAKIANLP